MPHVYTMEGHRRHRGGRSKLGRAAKHCKGRKRGAFKACVRKYMKRGR